VYHVMLLIYKLVCQGTRRVSEDNMAIREMGGRGVRKLQKVRSEELHNLCFSSNKFVKHLTE